MQTQSWSLSGQQGPGWSLPEGPVYSNNSTRPTVWKEARRLGLESTHSLHLHLIYPVSLSWEGQGKAALRSQSGTANFRQGPGTLTYRQEAPLASFAFATCIHSFKAQLETLPIRSSPDAVIPVRLAHPSTVRPALFQREAGGQWGRTGISAAPTTNAGALRNVPACFITSYFLSYKVLKFLYMKNGLQNQSIPSFFL